MIRGDEGADCAGGRREGVKLVAPQAIGLVRPDEVRIVIRQLATIAGSTGLSIRGLTSIDDALNRFCQLDGIVITTSPPISSDQW